LIPASVFHSVIVANPILLFFFFLVKRKKIINPFIGNATIELQVANLSSQSSTTAIYNEEFFLTLVEKDKQKYKPYYGLGLVMSAFLPDSFHFNAFSSTRVGVSFPATIEEELIATALIISAMFFISSVPISSLCL
jgi:hypothetical protein